MKVYFTVLPSTDGVSSRISATFRIILSEILQLHEEILGKLYEAVPNAEYNQRHAREVPSIPLKGHVRWHSADSVSGHLRELRLAKRLRHSIDIARQPKPFPVASIADTRSAFAVASVFADIVCTFALPSSTY